MNKNNEIKNTTTQDKVEKSGLRTAILVLALISMILACLTIIGAIWMVPMSLSIRRSINEGKTVSIPLSVCYLLFGLSPVAIATAICAMVDEAQNKNA